MESTIAYRELHVYKSSSVYPIEVSNNMFANHCGAVTNVLCSLHQSVVADKLVSKYPFGKQVIDPIIENFVENILHALVVFEQYGVTHGDIKLDNIVYHEEKYKFIDFGTMPNLDDKASPSQSHSDVYGFLVKRNITTKEYNQKSQAMYALGLVISSLLRRENAWMDKELRPTKCTVEIQSIPITVTTSEPACLIFNDEKSWVKNNIPEEWHSFILKLVGSRKFNSFSDAYEALTGIRVPLIGQRLMPSVVPVNNQSRLLYELCASNNMNAVSSVQVMNLYYMYHTLFDDQVALVNSLIKYKEKGYYDQIFYKIHGESDGLDITLPIKDKPSYRLLYEYVNQGSWLLDSVPEISLEELRIDGPPLIIFHNKIVTN